MWSPAPALGGALWQGNQTLATTRQLLSTSTGLANTGDSNFDAVNISTLYVSTITGFNNGTNRINILNTGNITISSFGNININASNLTLRATNVGQFLNNGQMLIDNRDPDTGRTTANETNILCGKGSFQALAGNLTVAGSSNLNLYAGNRVVFETYNSQNYLPNGVVDLSGNNLIAVRSLSTINVSTGVIQASDIRANSLSSIFVSTGLLKAGATVLDSLGVSGTTSLSNTLNMNTQNITNVNTIGATTGNFTSLTGNLTGNVSGNLTGNVTGNVSGNLTGNVTGNIFNNNLTVGGKFSITETADVGSAIADYGSYGTVSISGKGGLGGIVNITADVATPLNPAVTVSQVTVEAKGNYGLITPGTPVGYIPRGGLVSLVARQGLTPTPPAEVTSALFANGEIDLTAYSYGVVPGLIKLSAGANSMYAGPISPITGIIGTNNIYGTVANTITAGSPPTIIPTFPGTNYLYGAAGTSIQNTLYVDNITNYGNFTSGQYSNLSIFITTPVGQPARDVLMSNVKSIYMQNTPFIDGAGTGSINSFSNVNSSNLNVYKQGYISSLTVDDIVWNRLSENFDSLYTSTLYTSTITGFNNGTQALNLLNFSSINISTGALLAQWGSTISLLANKQLNTTSGLSTIVTAGTSAYITAPTTTIASGTTTTIASGTSVNLNTPIVRNQTHLDSPSISTLRFQATDFLATTINVATTTIDVLNVPLINGDPTMSISTTGLNIQASASSPPATTVTYSYTGADQTFTVPLGVYSIEITEMKGASGGQITTGGWSTPGKGGLVSGTLAVTPGEVLTIVVGGAGGTTSSATPIYGGGAPGNNTGQTGTNGGGRTAIRRGGGDIVVAGGGGGGAAISAFGDNNAGSGGGSNGDNGQGTDHSGSASGSTGGGGGTQTSNGAGGAGFNTAANFGSPGSGFQGGAPSYQCGGGGAGYYGGGGGGYSINDTSNSAGGGGGGSSYVGLLTGTVITVSGGGAVFPDPGTLTFTYTATPPGVVNILAGITNINSSDAINMTTNAINTDTDLVSISTITTNIKSIASFNLSTTLANLNTSTLTLGGGLYTNVSTFTNRRIRIMTVDTGGGDFWDSTGILYANTTGVANFTNSDSPTGGFEYACYDAVFSLAGFEGTLDAYNFTITGAYVTPAVNGSGNWYAACRATALPGVVGPPPTYHTKWYVTGIFFPKTLGAN